MHAIFYRIDNLPPNNTYRMLKKYMTSTISEVQINSTTDITSFLFKWLLPKSKK